MSTFAIIEENITRARSVLLGAFDARIQQLLIKLKSPTNMTTEEIEEAEKEIEFWKKYLKIFKKKRIPSFSAPASISLNKSIEAKKKLKELLILLKKEFELNKSQSQAESKFKNLLVGNTLEYDEVQLETLINTALSSLSEEDISIINLADASTLPLADASTLPLADASTLPLADASIFLNSPNRPSIKRAASFNYSPAKKARGGKYSKKIKKNKRKTKKLK